MKMPSDPHNRFFVVFLGCILFSFHSKIVAQSASSKSVATKYYSQAITDFIVTLKHQHSFLPDTIYFLKNNQFPEILLPHKVQNICIRLVANKEYDVILKKNPLSFAVNLVGFVNQNDAEFIFVCFRPGYQHQFDLSFEYHKNKPQNCLSLDQIYWQDFSRYKQPNKTLIFRFGKWLN